MLTHLSSLRLSACLCACIYFYLAPAAKKNRLHGKYAPDVVVPRAGQDQSQGPQTSSPKSTAQTLSAPTSPTKKKREGSSMISKATPIVAHDDDTGEKKVIAKKKKKRA